MFVKFSEKLTFLTSCYAPDTYQRIRNVNFSESFANVLNEWSLFELSIHCNVKNIQVPASLKGLKTLLKDFELPARQGR